ncbi:2-oxoacid ferredoxin oxidoreductase [Candidatus Peregrinibacteria bacterium]|jgi:2-oxoglutarate/2-oxoacid ferredoxin oxidoreductase subunit beta|nr:2-oxoacid ferredoxin oxidoreductase [Candidatus Peregrinibacteria bacterium]
MTCDPKNNCTEYLKGLAEKRAQYASFDNEEKITWCSGCGNMGIQNALKRAFSFEGLGVKDLLLCYDIGCNGNGSDKMGTYSLHGLHGRIISAAAGAAVANTNLKVIAIAGDGGTMSEGINHLVHAVRNDYPVLFVLHNNQNYGLTTGQASATTRKGYAMNGSPDGVTTEPMNPSEFALGLEPSFVARTFSGDMKHMTKIFREALNHKGFAFVEVMQVCPTYNKATPSKWFWDRLKFVEDIEGYNSADLEMAREAAHDMNDSLAMGILYRDPTMPSFMERLKSREGLETSILVDEVKHYDVSGFLEELQ